MTLALSILETLLTVLAVWTAISLVATPLVALLLSGHAREDERIVRILRREAWLAATQA